MCCANYMGTYGVDVMEDRKTSRHHRVLTEV